MDRRDFFSKLGIGAAFVLTANCISSCKKENLGPVDFTLDLSNPANAKLLTNGNYLVTNNVVVAKGTDGNYYAATVVCSHEQRHEVYYDKSANDYQCSAHSARFDLQGGGLNGNGSGGLTTYNTALANHMLRVYS